MGTASCERRVADASAAKDDDHGQQAPDPPFRATGTGHVANVL